MHTSVSNPDPNSHIPMHIRWFRDSNHVIHIGCLACRAKLDVDYAHETDAGRAILGRFVLDHAKCEYPVRAEGWQ
jgi:hypothetical protein